MKARILIPALAVLAIGATPCGGSSGEDGGGAVDASPETGPADSAVADGGPDASADGGADSAMSLDGGAADGGVDASADAASGDTGGVDGSTDGGAPDAGEVFRGCAGRADGAWCRDGDPCTTGETCEAGLCIVVANSCRRVFFEDFESGPDWTVGGVLPSWERGAPEPGRPAYSGSGIIATSLLGTGNIGEDSYIESPPIDMSGVSHDPYVRMRLRLQVRGNSRAFLEVSTDGGATYRTVHVGSRTFIGGATPLVADAGTVDWYPAINDPTIPMVPAEDGWRSDYGPPRYSPNWRADIPRPDIWSLVQTQVSGVAGESDVRFRIRYVAGANPSRGGVEVDDFAVLRDIPYDLGVRAFFGNELAPLPAPDVTCQSRPFEVTFHLANYGTIGTVDRTCPRCAGYWWLTSIPGPAPPDIRVFIDADGSRQELRFRNGLPWGETAIVVPITPGTMNVRLRAYITDGDEDLSDNTATFSAHVLPLIPLSTTYAEGFEMGGSDWHVVSGWEAGAPTGTLISSAPEGTQVLATRLGGAARGGVSYAYPPCFDLSGTTRNPRLRFQHAYDARPGMDTLQVQWSRGNYFFTNVEGGATWYNDGDHFSGASGWSMTSSALNLTAGLETVMLRWSADIASGPGRPEGWAIDDVTLVP